VSSSAFLKACRREPVAYTPVWLMRQAGRYMPEFRAIRRRVDFLKLCKSPDLAAEVTVMAVEQLGVDAAIIFADILLPLDAMRRELEYVKGEGPVIHKPVRSPAEVEALGYWSAREQLSYVFDAIKLTRQALKAEVALIGFAGAPFTVASYLIEGGGSRSFEKTKAFMYSHKTAWNTLLDQLTSFTCDYLSGQIEAGADSYQLFDSWVGCLSPEDYLEYVQPFSRRVFDTVRGAPAIHFGTGTAALLECMRDAGGEVIGIDWRIKLDEAWQRVGYDRAIQGNLDPCVLLSNKSEIKRRVELILGQAERRPGHIFNLGHGVLPPTDPQLVKYLVEAVHELSTAN
jgi:uroporphyrinogen decarboxylase